MMRRKNTSTMLPIFSMLSNNAERNNRFEGKNLAAELKKKPDEQKNKNNEEKRNNPEI